MLRRIRNMKLKRLFFKAVDVAAAVDSVLDIPGDWNGIRRLAKSLDISTHHRTKAEIVADLVSRGYRE